MLVACTKSGFALTSVEVTHSKELIGPVAAMRARRALNHWGWFYFLHQMVLFSASQTTYVGTRTAPTLAATRRTWCESASTSSRAAPWFPPRPPSWSGKTPYRVVSIFSQLFKENLYWAGCLSRASRHVKRSGEGGGLSGIAISTPSAFLVRENAVPSGQCFLLKTFWKVDSNWMSPYST